MQTPANLPYQAYRSKRHSRNHSGNNQLQNLSPNVSPPPPIRPAVYTNGHGLPVNGVSEPIVPLQRDFTGDFEKVKDAHERTHPHDEEDLEKDRDVFLAPPQNGVHGNGHGVVLNVNAAKMILDESRRSVSMTDVVTAYEARRNEPPPPAHSPPTPTKPIIITSTPNPVSPPEQEIATSPASTTSTQSSAPPITMPSHHENASQPIAGPSSSSSTPQTSPGPSPRPVLSSLSSGRKSSTFRRVPLRTPSARPNLPSSPLRPHSMIGLSAESRTSSGLSISSRFLGSDTQQPHESSTLRLKTPQPQSRPTSMILDKDKGGLPPIPLDTHSNNASPAPYRRRQGEVVTPQPRSSSLALPHFPHSHQRATSPGISPSVTPAISPSPLSPTSSLPTPTSTVSTATFGPPASAQRSTTPRATASTPYRPGFQPKGVYRPRTNEFLEMRRTRSDVGRVERTRLERRLEKLVNLHFPHPSLDAAEPGRKEKGKESQNATTRRQGNASNTTISAPSISRRASSFFEIDVASLRGKSAGDLWRGVVTSTQASASGGGGKTDIRAAEQKITPWVEDKEVKECPLCKASFHPLTNRKHHCRLCGRIICSLPVKYPQRTQPCSLLFVADPVTGYVEEVTEGVDYGVRRRTSSNAGVAGGAGAGKGKAREELSPEEKFLKGVRICRDCKPVLMRKQYIQEAQKVPIFARLYEAFILLEKEIEEALPQFQELMVSLSQDERPSLEASAARKRLLEAFAQYDALAKRMRKLPCPGGPGSSQDRVQQAILLRATNFLQKNMFPLQALPKTSKKPSPSPISPSSSSSTPSPHEQQPIIDPDSEVARILQPLLEQEALLESFVEEAKTHRKFEDAQTLKANLKEIRAEIDRVLANADGGLSERRPT